MSDYADAVSWVRPETLHLEEPLADVMARDRAPLPSTIDRERYSGDRHLDFWLTGLRDYLNIQRVVRRVDEQWDRREGRRVLDFGCASGRVLRHFVHQQPGIEVWGTDLNARNVEWVRRFLTPTVPVFQCTALPHVPIEDNTFDLIYALSVFTHIDRLELAWLLELRRLLKPGGVLYVSLHSDAGWSRMGPGIPLFATLMKKSAEIIEFAPTPEMFKSPMPAERVVFSYHGREIYNCNVFHSREYIRREWGRFMRVVDLIDQGSDWHDVAVLRK